MSAGRLTDDELRAAAARRTGYATYPEYRPGQRERLGRLPLAGRPAGYPSTRTISAATAPPVPTGPAPAAMAVPPPAPHLLLQFDRDISKTDAEAFKRAFQAKVAERGLRLEVLPPSPVFEFDPQRSLCRPWWRRRWSWAVMTGTGRSWWGYAWTRSGALRRTARAARRAAR